MRETLELLLMFMPKIQSCEGESSREECREPIVPAGLASSSAATGAYDGTYHRQFFANGEFHNESRWRKLFIDNGVICSVLTQIVWCPVSDDGITQSRWNFSKYALLLYECERPDCAFS